MNSLNIVMFVVFTLIIGFLTSWYETKYYWRMKNRIEQTRLFKTRKELWMIMLEKNMSEVMLFILGLGTGYLLGVF